MRVRDALSWFLGPYYSYYFLVVTPIILLYISYLLYTVWPPFTLAFLVFLYLVSIWLLVGRYLDEEAESKEVDSRPKVGFDLVSTLEVEDEHVD